MNDDELPQLEEWMKQTVSKPLDDAAWKADKKERKRLEDESTLLNAGVPRRHLFGDPLKIDNEWGKKFESIRQMKQGMILGLHGLRGNGKTRMAVEMMRSCVDGGKSVSYVTAIGLFLEIKDTYKSNSKESELDIIERYARPYMLVIDEFGQRKETAWEDQLIFELINRRYNDVKNTVLISNQDAVKFTEAIGPSLVSRMKETGGLIHCNWESFR